MLEKFYVGDLVSAQYPTFPEPGNFYNTVRERVRKHFEDTKQDPKISGWMWLRYFLVSAMTILLWFAQIFLSAQNFSLACVAGFLHGWFTALVAMLNAHDASHFAVTSNPLVWRLVGHMHDYLNGASYYVWIYQHIFGHHPFTNIDGVDPDISTAKEKPDMRRIKWSQNWLPRYFNQHVYMPLIYCLLGFKTYLQDFTTFISLKNSTMRLNPPSKSHVILFFSGKLFFFMHKVILPWMLLSFWKMAALLFLAEIATGYWLALIFQASHVVSEVCLKVLYRLKFYLHETTRMAFIVVISLLESKNTTAARVEWPQPDEKGVMKRDWAELQIESTLDYATDSWFWNVFTGALNHQTAHHLFPGVCQFYYPQITPIVRETCKEFGVRYNYKETFFQALGAHISHLKVLGQEQDRPIVTRPEVKAG